MPSNHYPVHARSRVVRRVLGLPAVGLQIREEQIELLARSRAGRRLPLNVRTACRRVAAAAASHWGWPAGGRLPQIHILRKEEHHRVIVLVTGIDENGCGHRDRLWTVAMIFCDILWLAEDANVRRQSSKRSAIGRPSHP